MLMTDVRLGLQDTLGSASDKADHHTTQAKKDGQSYLDSAKDQANQLFGQGQVRPEPSPRSKLRCATFSVAAQPFLHCLPNQAGWSCGGEQNLKSASASCASMHVSPWARRHAQASASQDMHLQDLQSHVLKWNSQRLLDVDCGGSCLQDKAGQAKEESKGYLDSAKDKANQLFGQTQDKAGQAKGEAKDTLGSTADKAGAKADEAHKEGKGELATHSYCFLWGFLS